MKLLCVYDPGLLFVERSARVPHDVLRDIFESFVDHEKARQMMGFKFAVSDSFYELICTDPDIGKYETWEILNSLIQMMVLYPEETSNDYCVIPSVLDESFEIELNLLFNSKLYLDQDLLNAWLSLLGACYVHEQQPRVCYATGLTEHGFVDAYSFCDNRGRNLYIVRNLFEWSEQYRLCRRGNAKRLPNEYSFYPSAEPAWFFFCPADPSFKEESDELEMNIIDDDSVRMNNWRRVAGRTKGYKDCWGNVWMWNDEEAQQHWDVQITRHFQNLIRAKSSHINVEPAGLEYPHNEPIPQGSIRHGLGDFEPVAICQVGCPRRNCPRKDRRHST